MHPRLNHILNVLETGLFERLSQMDSNSLPDKTALDAVYSIKKNLGMKEGIMIHGIMPRCGSGYCGQLFRLHPEIANYPNKMWEVPFLQNASYMARFTEMFLESYKKNKDRMKQKDLYPFYGLSFLLYMYSHCEKGKTMLLKVPSIRHLKYFFDFFPHEKLIVVLRDGRDMVE